MKNKQKDSFTIFAPAKVNLFLHITDRLSNGYHMLDSLVAFADIGDSIQIEPAESFSFHTKGPFANQFKTTENSGFLDSENLIVKAARFLSQTTDKPLNVKITLNKNLPLSSGIGGGSSDAAATIWGLQELWGLEHSEDYVMPIMTKLGADVPVCFHCRPTIMRGIGDVLLPAPDMPEIPILLVNPLVSCVTQNVFLHYDGSFKKNIDLPNRFNCVHELIKTLNMTENDLFDPAITIIPEIKNVINALNAQDSCLFSRMSGSGASCFGLFESIEHAEKAANKIITENPDWWVKTGFLNRPERY